MPYDETLAERVRAVFQSEPGYTEKKMFGGICFMIGRNMALGVTGSDLMVRPGPDNFEDAMMLPHARPMDFTGRPMKGFVYIGTEGIESDEELSEWVERSLSFNATLAAK
ncbi:MAG: TfoX/Sxy family protein [Chloroflexi bacterium]|nr:TfoX/Sxy family protein [Chloroflexota bacterium]